MISLQATTIEALWRKRILLLTKRPVKQHTSKMKAELKIMGWKIVLFYKIAKHHLTEHKLIHLVESWKLKEEEKEKLVLEIPMRLISLLLLIVHQNASHHTLSSRWRSGMKITNSLRQQLPPSNAKVQLIRTRKAQRAVPNGEIQTMLKGMKMIHKRQECKVESISSLPMKFSVTRLKMTKNKTVTVESVEREGATTKPVREAHLQQQQRLLLLEQSVVAAEVTSGLKKIRTTPLQPWLTKPRTKKFPNPNKLRLLLRSRKAKQLRPQSLLHVSRSNSSVTVCSVNNSKNGTCDLELDDPDLEQAATRIQAAFRGHNTRKQLGKMAEAEEVIDIDLNDPEVGIAATKIQASFRGHKARRQAEKKKEAELSDELEKLKTTEEKPAAEEEDLPDLNDPEVNKAATKIQAHFKGHLVRKTLKDPKDGDGDASN